MLDMISMRLVCHAKAICLIKWWMIIKLEDCIICVTADHATPCNLKAHSADPVPILICGGAIKGDGTLAFSERTATKGSLGKLLGREILGLLVKFAKE